ncbi:unnamed protein product [Phytophthora fragariaefolia]|uniref:Unnamed protein product n=1 Tax=Phytophthora fragariaefolia TaxID=1490495 RepID=A0A9W6XTA1_9STRA|nr:unnamed protein product [Phytophthora fragariaefolia]
MGLRSIVFMTLVYIVIVNSASPAVVKCKDSQVSIKDVAPSSLNDGHAQIRVLRTEDTAKSPKVHFTNSKVNVAADTYEERGLRDSLQRLVEKLKTHSQEWLSQLQNVLPMILHAF